MPDLVDDRILVYGNVLMRILGNGIAQMHDDVGSATVMENGEVNVVAAVGMENRILFLVTFEQTVLS